MRNKSTGTVKLVLVAIILFACYFIFLQPKRFSGVSVDPSTGDFSVDVCINSTCDYVADGQNDEREIEQAANAVIANGGGTVNIRTGNYSITSPINIALGGKSLSFVGDGFDTKLTNSMSDSSVTGTTFVVSDTATSTLNSLGFYNLQLVGTANSGAGVKITKVYRTEINGCKISTFSNTGNYGSGLVSASSTKILLGNNLFTGNNQNTNLLDTYTSLSLIGDSRITFFGDGYATSTKTSVFQAATSAYQATTTVEFGKSGQGKGVCIKTYNAAGTATYCSINGTTLSCSATSCE